MRVFVAVPVAEEITEKLRSLVKKLQPGVPLGAIRWTNLEQAHLTLKFLGDIPDEAAGELATRLREAGAGIPPIPLRAEQLGCFPDFRNPRVVWIGVSGAGETLAELQGRVERATARFAPAEEGGRFHPHLTLGRVKNVSPRERRQLGERLQSERVDSLGGWTVERVLLMKSELAPEGPRHTELISIPLVAT